MDDLGLIAAKLMLDEEEPPITAPLYEYLVAANGTFIRAKRPGLGASVQVGGSRSKLIGLYPTAPYARLSYPQVPEIILRHLLAQSRSARDEHGKPVEALFHLWWDGSWQWSMPPQNATRGSVIPLEAGADSSYGRALIEVHSHHTMSAFFSATDDADETGFRIYGVIGKIFDEPTLRLRVGVHGYHYELAAGEVFSLPSEFIRGEWREPSVLVTAPKEAATDANSGIGLRRSGAGAGQGNRTGGGLLGWLRRHGELARATRRAAGEDVERTRQEG